MAVKAVSLRNYDLKYLTCRDLRHPFEVIGYHRDSTGQVHRRLKCLRCGAIGKDYLSRVGERKKGRSYKYPDGYLIEGGVKLTAVRMEEIRRAKIYSNEDAMLAAVTNGRSAKKRVTPTKKKKVVHPIKHRARRKVGAR